MILKRLKSLRTQTILFTMALLLGLGGLTVVLGAWATHRLKQHLVQEAHEYAREQVVKSCQEIQNIMQRKGVRSVEAASELPEVSQQIRIILARNDTIQMLAILNRDGTMVHQYCNNKVAAVKTVGEDGTVSDKVKGVNANYTLTIEPINAPLPVVDSGVQEANNDGKVGYLAFQMAEDLSGSQRMQRLSHAVTDSLGWMVSLLLAILAVAMALLYKVFTRHLSLEKEKDAQAKMAAIGTLASGLAHEIRNPLQVINMNLDVIREDLEEVSENSSSPERGQTTRILSGVQGQITHLNHILHDFMQFAIPGRMEKEELSLRTLIGDTLEFMAPELARNHVETEIRIPESARIVGDPSALRRVVLNILINAVKAMEESPERRLIIGAEEVRSGGWQVWFEDTGCGIPEGKEEEVFEAFVSFRPGGTGFGLAIARRIIEEHGGHIRAEYRAPGAGAFIRIILPGPDTDETAHPYERHAAASSPVP